MSKSPATSNMRRPVGGRISLTSFAQRKGEVKALEAFKKRKNDKRKMTSIALRKYRRVMKQEGLEAGTGASRKRKQSSLDDEIKSDRVDDENRQQDDGDGEDRDDDDHRKKKHVKRGKTNPFQKSIEKAEWAKKQAEQVKIDKIKNEKDRQQKLKQRREQAKLLKQRTRKGQPVMKNQIQNLLQKIEKQNQQEQQHKQQQKGHRK